MVILVSDLSWSLFQPMRPLLHFLSPVQHWRENDRGVLVVVWHPARVSPLHYTHHRWRPMIYSKYCMKMHYFPPLNYGWFSMTNTCLLHVWLRIGSTQKNNRIWKFPRTRQGSRCHKVIAVATAMRNSWTEVTAVKRHSQEGLFFSSFFLFPNAHPQHTHSRLFHSHQNSSSSSSTGTHSSKGSGLWVLCSQMMPDVWL